MRHAAATTLAVTATLATCVAAAGSGAAAAAPPLLASAPVDAAVFRDGEVQRTATPFGSWTLVCDAIARLGHKFCSLRSAPVQLGGTAVEMLVSTGDDGRPAALLRLPFGLSLPFGLHVAPLGANRAPAHRVPVALCGGAGCEAVWTLQPDEIAALRTGRGLAVTVAGWRFDHGTHPNPPPVTAQIAATGFAQAITESLK